MPKWNEFEPFEAPGRDRSARVRLTISQEYVDTLVEVRRLTPLFWLSSHVFGRLPEINLIRLVENAQPTTQLTTLDDAYALFEGIKRPHDDENNGESVLVYVLRPSVSIEFAASMGCQAQAALPPENAVLTVLVRTNKPLQDEDGEIHGVVTRIEWVISEGKKEILPKEYEKRYNKRHW